MEQEFPDNSFDHGRVTRTAICVRCGYELEGLPSAGACPECGLPLSESLAHRPFGLAAPEHVRALTHGATLTAAALVWWMAGGIAQSPVIASLFAPGAQRLFFALDLPAAAVLCWGVWKLTDDDPGLEERYQARANKRIMRFAAAGLAALALVRLALSLTMTIPIPTAARTALPLLWSLLSLLLQLAATALWLMLATGTTNHTRWIAARVPDRTLFQIGKTMSWVIPAAVIVAFGLWFLFGTASRLLPLSLLTFVALAIRERLIRLRPA